MAWSMVLGPGAGPPKVVERVIRQIDMAPTIASWMGFESTQAAGHRIPEFHV